mmetsp:Transcript_36932/g.89703  ORF Transcript_36932/g.89703 Transcript_36932/m.89703 type:complete len:132 (+) Transcript_36932:276-671(+)
MKGLKHDFGHAFTVGFWVHGSLGKNNRLVLGGNTELIVKRVVPNLFHIVPVGNNTLLNGILEIQKITLGPGFITDVLSSGSLSSSRGRPMMEVKTDFGASSPAKPTLLFSEPLSMTTAEISLSLLSAILLD